jgi:adenosylcobinamide-phosphate synthase
MIGTAGQLLAILPLEAAVGYPATLLRRIGHPVMVFGWMIGACERNWNVGSSVRRRLTGICLLLLLILVAGGIGWMITIAAGQGWGMIAIILIATTGLAQRSLYDHVAAVLRPLKFLPELVSGRGTARRVVEGSPVPPDCSAVPSTGFAGPPSRSGEEFFGQARTAVSMIVGRDTEALDESGIALAAIESLAESFCDGVVAPAFWFLIGGLPGLTICKAINTADSIVGHRDDRYRDFGWASARADDLVNLIPARIAGLLICIAGAGGLGVMLRDARHHASPNGGWPEAAMAGVLRRRLGGAVSYDGEPADRAMLGDGRPPDKHDLARALAVYRRACLLLWLMTGGVAWLR